jgi:putative transposase
MGHPLRMYGASDCWFITSRCFQARMLMTPRLPLVREVCGGVLAHAANKYDVKIYAYVFMSNHVHLVVGAKGPQVARFVKYFLGNLAIKLAPLCKRRWIGKFWERRASVTAILDAAALEERVGYVLKHGIKENLVARAQDWEGLHCADQLMDALPRKFAWFDWTRRWATRNRKAFGEGPFHGRYDDAWKTPVELKISPMPHRVKDPHRVRCAWVHAVLSNAELARKKAGKPPLGMRRIKRQTTAPPSRRKVGPRPTCHASSSEDWKAFKAMARDFHRAFREAASEWLTGKVDAVFPPDCFKPHVSNHTLLNVQIV